DDAESNQPFSHQITLESQGGGSFYRVLGYTAGSLQYAAGVALDVSGPTVLTSLFLPDVIVNSIGGPTTLHLRDHNANINNVNAPLDVYDGNVVNLVPAGVQNALRVFGHYANSPTQLNLDLSSDKNGEIVNLGQQGAAPFLYFINGLSPVDIL